MRARRQDRIALGLTAPLLLAAGAACAHVPGGSAPPAAASAGASDSAGAAAYATAPTTRRRGASASRVGRADIERAGDMNLAAFIESHLSGVRVVQNRGDLAVVITGLSFQSNVGALVLIDGTEGQLGALSLRDIASMEVLKDSAASVYGVRGANGVLLVTTRKR